MVKFSVPRLGSSNPPRKRSGQISNQNKQDHNLSWSRFTAGWSCL